jgi:hypothetical protein
MHEKPAVWKKNAIMTQRRQSGTKKAKGKHACVFHADSRPQTTPEDYHIERKQHENDRRHHQTFQT